MTKGLEFGIVVLYQKQKCIIRTLFWMRLMPQRPMKEKAVLQEMQIFMYAVMDEHLKTVKGKSLVSKYEVDNDAQSIYRELKKHGTSSTAAWLAGDIQYTLKSFAIAFALAVADGCCSMTTTIGSG
jgi:hypothetical protein